jgi:Importin-beta N-terminal domain
MAAELAALLEECLSPDNAVRRRAEAAARGLARSPDIVPALLGVLRGNVDAQVRQLAAVLLRKWTGRHWVRLPAEVRHV